MGHFRLSVYEANLKALEDTKCKPCKGKGEYSNQQTGGMSWDVYKCQCCGGTGIKDENKTV